MSNITAKGQMALSNMSKIDQDLIQLAQDTYRIAQTENAKSVAQGHVALDMYHNRQWTEAQLATLNTRGQPAETFNVFKMLAHAMVGYFDTVANEISVEPTHMNSAVSAMVVNDVVSFVQDRNDYESIRRQLQLDALLTGLAVCYETVKETGQTDQYGRKLYKIELERVPSWQVRIDPMSRRDDMSDSRFTHRFKWLPEEEVHRVWGAKKTKGLVEYYNELDGDPEADWYREYDSAAIGQYRQWNNYQIIHSVVSYKGDQWELVWSNYSLLEKKKVSFKAVRSPYRAVKLYQSDKAGYYGAFEEIIETQKAINQALIQIQQLINTSKAIVEDNAVENMDEFKKTFNRVNGVVVVSDLQGIKIEDMSRDIAAQYTIIDQALIRIKSVLGINDSFLGQAFASDSGRKVQLQSNSSASQLSILTDRIKYMNKMIGWDIVKLAQQYMTGEQFLRVADPVNGARYTAVNQPLMMPTGQEDPANPGQELMQPIFEAEEDPATGEYLKDEDGAIIMTPLNNPDTDIKFAEVDITVVASQSNNAEERNQLLLETFINGPIGAYVGQLDPAAYLQATSLMVQEFGTKHSPALAKLLQDLAAKINNGEVDPTLAMSGGDMQAILGTAMGGSGGGSNAVSGKKSQALQVPTRFNNGGTE